MRVRSVLVLAFRLPPPASFLVPRPWFLCAFGSAGSRCRRPRPRVLMCSLSPAREGAGDWCVCSGLVPRPSCLLASERRAAGLLPLDGVCCRWAGVVPDLAGRRSWPVRCAGADGVGCVWPAWVGPVSQGWVGLLSRAFGRPGARCCQWAGTAVTAVPRRRASGLLPQSQRSNHGLHLVQMINSCCQLFRAWRRCPAVILVSGVSRIHERGALRRLELRQ